MASGGIGGQASNNKLQKTNNTKITNFNVQTFDILRFGALELFVI